MDTFILCTGMAELHRKVLAEYLLEQVTKEGFTPISVAGLEYLTVWILVDFGSIVLHIFSPEARKFYNLEGIWGLEDGKNIIQVEEQ